MKLFILRHGKTSFNQVRRLQGQRDIPLCEEGRRQAMEAGRFFSGLPLDLCLTSPLSRARETAELFLSGREVPIIEEPLLKEVAFGEFEGEDFSRTGKPHVREALRLFFHEPQSYQPPQGGESLWDVTERARRLLEKLSQMEDGERSLLLSTHACFARALLQCLPGSRMEDYWRGKIPPNCSLSCLSLKEGRVELLFQDRTGQ